MPGQARREGSGPCYSLCSFARARIIVPQRKARARKQVTVYEVCCGPRHMRIVPPKITVRNTMRNEWQVAGLWLCGATPQPYKSTQNVTSCGILISSTST